MLYKYSFTFIKYKLYDLYDLISLNAIWYELVLNVNLVNVHSINDFFAQRCPHDISLSFGLKRYFPQPMTLTTNGFCCRTDYVRV